MNKKVRDFLMKNPSMRAFLAGVEKRDEKFIYAAMKNSELEAAEKVIKKDTRDRSLLFVASGALIAFKDGQNEIYEEGAILGIE